MSIKKFSLKVVSSSDYDKLAEKYPKKIRARILESKGFSDMKRMMAFVRGGKDALDMAGTAMHEILELTASVSPHEEANLRFKGGKTQINQVTPQLTPEQQDYYSNVYKPYYQTQSQLYQNTYAPIAQQMGSQISNQLQNGITSPTFTPTTYNLPEDQYANIWQQAAGNINKQYGTQERQLGQRLASTGALDNSGQSTKAFQKLGTEKMQTLENQAVQQAIQSWQDKKAASQMNWQAQNQAGQMNWQQAINNQQLPFQNALQYMQQAPSFGMQLPNQQIVATQSGNKQGWIDTTINGVNAVANLMGGGGGGDGGGKQAMTSASGATY